ncbi:Flp pilus assembly protein CpaB [Sphingomonas sp. GCM10030256]|uniref:Flp pilus assembly protein CpaB n=1 Tax=Sphingomonas sp. GCM10030256 TaxID=3273427 RepID=UPI00361E7A23
MLRRQTMIALGIAVVLGLLAVYLADVFLDAKSRAVADTGGPKLAVAAVPLDYGAELTPDKIRFISYSAEAMPAGSYASIQALLPAGKRRVVLRPIAVNEPILAGKISGEGQGASIASLLPDGKRAAAVRINDVSGVAGFIQPNDSVDVLITRQAGADRMANRQLTDVLLQNVRVIAMDQKADGEDGKPAVASTATLEVTPVDAQKLALGQQVGTLSLVLRKPGEQQDASLAETVSLEDLRYSLYGGSYPRQSAVQASAPRPVRVTRLSPPKQPVRRREPAAAAPQGPVTNNVQVVRGTTNTSYEVGDFGG